MVRGDLDGQHSTPKLPILSQTWPKPAEPHGLLTPPLHPGVAVPFQWEEAPGRPRPCLPRSPYLPPALSDGAKRCLDLPPRLLHDNHVTILSPTTVMEGPYSCYRKRPRSTWSFRQVGSRERIVFGSTRWEGGHECDSGISFSEFFHCDCDRDVTGDGKTKVKITRIRRRRSFLSLSHKQSHLWARIYEGLKQVIPWRRRPTPTAEANRNLRSSPTTTTMKSP